MIAPMPAYRVAIFLRQVKRRLKFLALHRSACILMRLKAQLSRRRCLLPKTMLDAPICILFNMARSLLYGAEMLQSRKYTFESSRVDINF